jgi:hypothetical protein
MDWEGDIKLTRPITLIGYIRKFMFKIIIKRLMKDNHVLIGNNYDKKLFYLII